MIELKKIEGRILIDSLDLFLALGKRRRKYYLWLKHRVRNNLALEQPRDFFLIKVNPEKGRRRIHALISPEVAMSICVWEGTVVSKNIRNHIRKTIEEIRKSP